MCTWPASPTYPKGLISSLLPVLLSTLCQSHPSSPEYWPLVRCWTKSGGAFKARAGVPHDLHLPSIPRRSHTDIFVPPPLPTGFGPSKCRDHPRASELGRHQRYSAWQAIYAEGSHPREQEGSLVGCRRSHGAARGSGQAEPARVE